MKSPDTRLRWACYGANVSMAVVATLSPLLFLTFREKYGISYSLLGLLVLINFCTQLAVDLVFSFFSHRFNIPKTVKITPALTVIGLIVYALLPALFPDHAYAGVVIGTVIFSASSGLAEVLISPVMAAIPSDDPDREMSKLHSVYAWGVVCVVLFCTLFLRIFGDDYWMILSLILALIPLVSTVLFLGAEVPHMDTPEKVSGSLAYLKNPQIWLCLFAIFLGGASECTMAQWSSGYLEMALGIPKTYGDIFGVALFSVALGLGRSLYAKFGRHVHKVLILGACGATLCYLVASLSPFPVVGLLACAFTGFCVSMLWPGNLIVASGRFPECGVFIYAAMAAGGDLGASVAPQLVGSITDLAMSHPALCEFAQRLHLTPDQFGMKLGMLVGMLFPLTAIFVYRHSARKSRDNGHI